MKLFPAALLLLSVPVAAQPAASLVEVRASASPGSVPPGGSFSLVVTATLRAGWHVNAHKPSEDYLIATNVSLTAPAGITFAELQYPPATQVKFSFSDKPLAVYEGAIEVKGRGAVAAAATPGPREVSGVFSYQPCNDKQCLAPARVPFRCPVSIAAASPKPAAAGPVREAGSGGPASTAGPDLAAVLSSRGLVLFFAFLFLGGLALNLTPCVYPIIPITIGFFGGQSSGKSGRPLGLASVYVLGMAITYSVLGVAAALSGRLFGSALQSPWVLGGIAAVLVALSLSMFGLYDINPPRFLMNRAGAKTGLGGAFGMGLLVGVVAAPCLGPFVLGLLTFVAARHDPLLGFAMFFVLSLGLGLPYLFLALFSGGLSKLPKAGAWMVEIKKVFGFVLLAMASYFLQTVLPEPLKSWLLPAVLAVGGAFVILGVLRARVPGLARAAVAGGGIVLLAGAAHFTPAPRARAEHLVFQPFPAGAATPGRAAMVDFSADWCIPCHELDDVTFADPRVQRALAGMDLYRADMTRGDSPEALTLSGRFAIVGMPTIVFLDSTGKEIPDSRLVGFEPPDRFLERLEKLRS
ncbi:MAG: cytochrome c biogenesis protein CcdA [Thermoanaerobaculia bacterium]